MEAVPTIPTPTPQAAALLPPKLKQHAIDAKKPLPPEEDVVLVTIGARALVPSDGKKLYVFDKHHHATAAHEEATTGTASSAASSSTAPLYFLCW